MSAPNTTEKKAVKDRAKMALNDEFLRNAVKFTTEKLRKGKETATE